MFLQDDSPADAGGPADNVIGHDGQVPAADEAGASPAPGQLSNTRSRPFFDFRQYGGIKGNSTSHYLIELINFILYNQDNTEATAVLACLVDFSKAFNRQDHSILVTKLSDMGTPSWLLKIMIAFLKDRLMVVRYKVETSSMKQLPGGGPQGALLGLFLFYSSYCAVGLIVGGATHSSHLFQPIEFRI